MWYTRAEDGQISVGSVYVRMQVNLSASVVCQRVPLCSSMGTVSLYH